MCNIVTKYYYLTAHDLYFVYTYLPPCLLCLYHLLYTIYIFISFLIQSLYIAIWQTLDASHIMNVCIIRGLLYLISTNITPNPISLGKKELFCAQLDKRRDLRKMQTCLYVYVQIKSLFKLYIYPYIQYLFIPELFRECKSQNIYSYLQMW